MALTFRIASTLIALLFSFSSIPTAGFAAQQTDIDIRDAEAVPSPMMLGVVSVFMRISNNGSSGDELVAVRTTIPKSGGMLHDVQDGKMVMLDKISIPAGRVTVLRPGGLHIMLFNMPRELTQGEAFTLYLTFAKSGEHQVKVKVMSKK